MYIGKFGFKRSKVKVTGYGRTDQLVDGSLNKQEILTKYSIPKAKKYILIAPTWKQDSSGRSVLPFGLEESNFFGELDKLAKRYKAQVIFRTHLNSDDEINVSHLTNTSFMPYSKYPVIEDFLFITDILVNDWSSTAIDFLPLKRPVIFLDVPAPFKKGFELGPEHRYGDVVKDFNGLKNSLEKYLKSPEEFIKKHEAEIDKTTEAAYGNSLDGKSLERYFSNLERLLQI
jgi:CDP-glycerol glycerophosphotransferase